MRKCINAFDYIENSMITNIEMHVPEKNEDTMRRYLNSKYWLKGRDLDAAVIAVIETQNPDDLPHRIQHPVRLEITLMNNSSNVRYRSEIMNTFIVANEKGTTLMPNFRDKPIFVTVDREVVSCEERNENHECK